MKYSSKHSELKSIVKFPSKEFEFCSIEDLNDYKKVVMGPAYTDFSPRTIAGMKRDNILSALGWLAEAIYNYFHSDEVNFNEWHKSICTEFCRKIEVMHGAIPYGKAQKIVNMSFKYLYCFNDSQKYATKFEECHMALDTYTLEWFIRYVLADKKIKVTPIREDSWSKLKCGENDREKYSYLWIQKLIRSYLFSEGNITYRDENGKVLSPFLAEFYIWKEMQLHMAMEELYAQIGADKKSFKKMSIPEKSAILQTLLEDIT